MSFVSGDAAVGETLFSADQIAQRIAELGARLTQQYAGRNPLLVCVLKGAHVFVTDLARHIDLPTEVDFIAVSSYGSSTRRSGVVRLVKDLDEDLTDRDVILVEDIIDSGLTLRYLRRNLEARNPRSLEVCALIARESADFEGLDASLIGFVIPDGDWLIGYGLDVDQRYRNLPYLAKYVDPSR